MEPVNPLVSHYLKIIHEQRAAVKTVSQCVATPIIGMWFPSNYLCLSCISTARSRQKLLAQLSTFTCNDTATHQAILCFIKPPLNWWKADSTARHPAHWCSMLCGWTEETFQMISSFQLKGYHFQLSSSTSLKDMWSLASGFPYQTLNQTLEKRQGWRLIRQPQRPKWRAAPSLWSESTRLSKCVSVNTCEINIRGVAATMEGVMERAVFERSRACVLTRIEWGALPLWNQWPLKRIKTNFLMQNIYL